MRYLFILAISLLLGACSKSFDLDELVASGHKSELFKEARDACDEVPLDKRKQNTTCKVYEAAVQKIDSAAWAKHKDEIFEICKKYQNLNRLNAYNLFELNEVFYHTYQKWDDFVTNLPSEGYREIINKFPKLEMWARFSYVYRNKKNEIIEDQMATFQPGWRNYIFFKDRHKVWIVPSKKEGFYDIKHYFQYTGKYSQTTYIVGMTAINENSNIYGSQSYETRAQLPDW